MSRSAFFEQERRLQAERYIKYRGTARVRLEHMHFEWNETRELNRKNVQRLREVFRTENVRRLEPRNHIPAVVDQAELDSALQLSKCSAETLLSNTNAEPPELKFPARHRVTCLHGRHRVQAARETLPPTDAWWVVDFYLKDSNPGFRTTLIEEYSNEEKPSDGEIYRKIRQYEREGNICFKKRWKALLSKHGRRSLQQLSNHREGELAAAFDNLLDIPGLWAGMRISTLHKIMQMKCDEEVIHYLFHIKNIWDGLLRRDKAALQRVDEATVEALETRAPRCSRQDALLLEGQLLSGQIFTAFSRAEREEIWHALQSIDCVIPSLYTFFEDVKYLHDCANCLKRLIKLPRGSTISLALQRNFPYNYNADGQCVIETAESTFVVRSQPTDALNLGYRQLWAFAMRHYREMPAEAKKDSKDLLARAAVERADEGVLSEFAALADRLGFHSSKIQALKQLSSDAQIARNALLKARKPSRYQYDQAAMEAHVAQIMRMFTTATPISRQNSNPTLVSDNPDAPGKRCGFPDGDSQQRDKEYLFIPHLHQREEEQGEYITSFFVRRSVYLAFLGKLEDSENGYGYGMSLPQCLPKRVETLLGMGGAETKIEKVGNS
ncbi:uncharacterized protein HMPREF1541_10636 [Cyphellophora europaea CBS 101466]|uniref:Uncharacterized protein n=1 Tax=Cyphellophora europaea (strain CBS 101466) TaxID=1220924 RepID=W2S757_CYPE1|nr:uncharacterized protein HMPREF1541_10636 [Cyphellophora europaea CBS 101466]ETN44455.1 hypothetical protein HMPREF1541_10636 [Cyphellophora europaea CBS 101466]